eukprot:10622944-Ditylum_brightwellii.AAC.1
MEERGECRKTLRRGRASTFQLAELDTWGAQNSSKQRGYTRFLFENLDGLGLTRRKQEKTIKLRNIRRKIEADAFGGVEVRTN